MVTLQAPGRADIVTIHLEATMGFEPMIRVLQTLAYFGDSQCPDRRRELVVFVTIILQLATGDRVNIVYGISLARFSSSAHSIYLSPQRSCGSSTATLAPDRHLP